MMTIEIESDHDCDDVVVGVKYAIWLVISSTDHFLTDDSLQSADKDQQDSRAVAGNRTYDVVVKFDTSYRNLQQHRTVLPARQ